MRKERGMGIGSGWGRSYKRKGSVLNGAKIRKVMPRPFSFRGVEFLGIRVLVWSARDMV